MVPALSSWLIFGLEGRAVTFLCGPSFATVVHCTWWPLGGTFCPLYASGQCVYWVMWADAELKRQFLFHFLCSKFPNPDGFLTHASLSVLISICPANIDPAALRGNTGIEEALSPSVVDRLLEDTNTSLHTGTGTCEMPALCRGRRRGALQLRRGLHAQGGSRSGHPAPQVVAGLRPPGQGLHLHPSVPWAAPTSHHLLL